MTAPQYKNSHLPKYSIFNIQYSTLFSLIRLPNLFIVALTQGLLYYFVILPFFTNASIHSTLGPVNFCLLVFSTLLIAAGGYIVNDIYDQDMDRLNKPDKMVIGKYIQEKTAWNLYLLIVALGGITSIYLGWVENKLGLLPLYPIAVALLWVYAAYLKRMPLWGNLVVALFCAFVAGIVWIGEYESWELLQQSAPNEARQLKTLLFGYLWFAFSSTLFRELIKDIEDMEGDAKLGCRTLPVVIGRERTKFFTGFTGGLLFISLCYWAYNYHIKEFSFGLGYLFVGIIIPLGWSIIRLSQARKPAEFHQLSRWAKYLMLSGLIYFLMLGLGW